MNVTTIAQPSTHGRSWRARLRALALPVYKPSRSVLIPSWWQYLLMRPAIFEVWFRFRAWWHMLAGHGFRSLEGASVSSSSSFLEGVRSYNRSKLWEFYRVRTEKFMNVLRCIDAVPRDARILVIGPRNEAELLLLSLYGFPLRNITSIDLFSYSPLVRCMDMHKLEFADDSFDVAYSAWTLKYAYDLEQACAELVRVVRPGGLIVTGFSHTQATTAEVGAPLAGGIDELLATFGSRVGWVYWKESTPLSDGSAEEVSVIFRVAKSSNASPTAG